MLPPQFISLPIDECSSQVSSEKLELCRVVSAETHKRTEPRGQLTVACSATVGLQLHTSSTQSSGSIMEDKWKENKSPRSERTREDQRGPERTREDQRGLMVMSHSSCASLHKACTSSSQSACQHGWGGEPALFKGVASGRLCLSEWPYTAESTGSTN